MGYSEEKYNISEKKCQCKTDESSFSLIKSKMKVLKKIKRRMGLGLYFHKFHSFIRLLVYRIFAVVCVHA